MDASATKIISQVLEEYCVDIKVGAAINAAITLIKGLIKKQAISKSKIQKAVDFLVKHYDKYLTIMSAVGLGLGILFSIDSNNDRNAVRRLQSEVIATFKNYPANLWERRLDEIRASIKELKTRQWTTDAVKFLVSIALGYVSYASTASVLAKTALAVGAGASGVSTIISSVNYYNLHELIKLLERDGYLN